MKTSELVGPALNWAVLRCEAKRLGKLEFFDSIGGYGTSMSFPSEMWADGGPIIEREQIGLVQPGSTLTQEWGASYWHPDFMDGTGPTPLIAAMRCYVRKVFGDEVEVPEMMR